MKKKFYLFSNKDIVGLFVIFLFYGFVTSADEYRIMFLHEHGLSATESGTVLAIAYLVGAISRILSGIVADKIHSRKKVYTFFIIGWICSMTALLLTQHVMIATFLLCSVFVPFLNICEQATYGMMEASGVNAAKIQSSIDYSFIRLCLSIGFCALSFAHTPLINHFGSSSPFVIALFCLIPLLFLSRIIKKFETKLEENETKEVFEKAAPAKKKLNFRQLFSNYYLITFVLLNLIYQASTYTQSYLVYLIEELNFDTSVVGYATGIRVLGELICMPLVPLLKEKFSLPMLQGIAGGLTLTQMVLYLVIRNPYILVSVIILNGLAGGITLTTAAVYLRKMAPEGLDTTTLSLNMCTTNLGYMSMFLIGGIIVDNLGIFAVYRFALILVASWIVLYFGTWLFGKYVLKKEPPAPMFLKQTD